MKMAQYLVRGFGVMLYSKYYNNMHFMYFHYIRCFRLQMNGPTRKRLQTIFWLNATLRRKFRGEFKAG
ncbi:hypothetical protein Hanom_Chr06g00566541 [Helianthus anomalus]